MIAEREVIMHFGFSYVGLIFLLMLYVPNLIWTRFKPVDYEKYVINENKLLLSLERIGEVLVTAVALIFSDFNLKAFSYRYIFLILAFILMIIYELYWVRYFKSSHLMSDFYRSFLFFPLAGATLPVLAFFMLSLYGENPILLLSVVILGIGHIGIHYNHRKEVLNDKG